MLKCLGLFGGRGAAKFKDQHRFMSLDASTKKLVDNFFICKMSFYVKNNLQSTSLVRELQCMSILTKG